MPTESDARMHDPLPPYVLRQLQRSQSQALGRLNITLLLGDYLDILEPRDAHRDCY